MAGGRLCVGRRGKVSETLPSRLGAKQQERRGGGTHCGWVPDDVSNQLGSAVRRKCSAGWMGYGGMAQGEVNEGR